MIGLHLRLGIEIGICRAGGVTPGSRRLTLLKGREAAIAGTAAEIAALDAIGKSARRSARNDRAEARNRQHQENRLAHRYLRHLPVSEQQQSRMRGSTHVPACVNLRV